VKQRRFDEACPKLAESQRLDPKLGTLLNLAVCHEQQGRTATAWAEYTSAAAIARRDGQREREDFARKQATALDKRLARVILSVSAADPNLAVKLDGQMMTAAVYGVPLPVDPGPHHVTATAPGKASWQTSIDVPAQPGEILVPIPPLAPAEVKEPLPQAPPRQPAVPPTPVVAPPVSAPEPPAPAPPPKEPPSSTPKVLMGVGFGVGGLGLVIGAIAGGVSIANTSSIRGSCTGDVCPGQSGAISSANTLANVSNAMFAIGVVGIGVGIAGVVLRPRDTNTTALTLTPIATPQGGALRLGF